MKRIVQVAVAALVVMLMPSCARFRTSAPEAQVDPPGIAVAPAPCLDGMPDTDGDGLSDACELALASAFAPRLMLHDTRCTLPAAGAGGHIAGGYFHAAQPVRGIVRLVYMPAYYRDCGWRSAWCILVDCRGHAGDSEMIVVDVRPSEGGGWITEAIFLSAHCYGNAEDDCRWFRGKELDAFEWVGGIVRGAPIVWVSDGRNANYPSRAGCDQGHFGLDGCGRDAMRFRFPVAAERNIGSRVLPIRDGDHTAGCVSGRFVEPHDRMIVAHAALECFWDASAPFGGWQGEDVRVTPYGRYLEDLGL